MGIRITSDELDAKSFAEEARSWRPAQYTQGIVMLAGKRDLEDLYRHSRPTTLELRVMFHQIFEDIAHLHDKRIMHGPGLRGQLLVRFESQDQVAGAGWCVWHTSLCA